MHRTGCKFNASFMKKAMLLALERRHVTSNNLLGVVIGGHYNFFLTLLSNQNICPKAHPTGLIFLIYMVYYSPN
jgi:hypothetical protein